MSHFPSLAALRRQLYTHLVDQVMPFWLRHGVDRVHGGLYSYLDVDGTLLERTKSGVSNTRALYTFAALVDALEDRPDWREAAANQYRFLRDHGRDADGLWVYSYDETGRTLRGEASIVVDAFAIMGLTAYYRISGEAESLDLALATAASVRERLARPGSYKTAPYPTPPGMRAQRENMQFSLAFAELGRAAGDAALTAAGMQLGREVLDHYYRADRGVLHEYLGLDYQPLDSPAGRCMVPGHAIESLGFQMRVFGQITATETTRAQQAARALQPCLEKGWDPDYGGIFLGIDVDGREPVYWEQGEMKRWWPLTEAMPACLLAYEILGEDWCLAWYWRCHDWAFAHCPYPEQPGLWCQNLTRDGRRIRGPQDLGLSPGETLRTLDLRGKDPFHLPRGLLLSINTIDRILAASPVT